MYLKLSGGIIIAAISLFSMGTAGTTPKETKATSPTECCALGEPCCDTPDACCGLSTAKAEKAQADCCPECEGCCELCGSCCVAGAKTTSDKACDACCYPGSPCCSADCRK